MCCDPYIRSRKDRKIGARNRQVRDVLYQQHHEYCRERQLTKGWWCISRIDNWHTAIAEQACTLGEKYCAKGDRWNNAVRIVDYLGECYGMSCNPRVREDLCASIPAMFKPRLVKCVARYEEDVAGEKEVVAECESDSDSYVNPDLFTDEVESGCDEWFS